MTPLTYQWDGDAMIPLGRFAKVADKQFVVGETYQLEVIQQRSSESHRHYFAAINEAWQNIPEIHADRFPSPEHLRKWALVRAGFRTETAYLAHSKAEALRFSAFLRGMDEYSVVHVEGNSVTLYVAKSQSLSSMSKAEFQDSKTKVLDVIAELIGVPTEELRDNAGKAA